MAASNEMTTVKDGDIVGVNYGLKMTDPGTGKVYYLEPEYNKDGKPKGFQSSITNFCRILENDSSIAGAICYNELTYTRWVRADRLPWSSQPVDRAWSNADEAYLRRWFWEEYGIKSKDNVSDAVTIAESQKNINPIRELLDGLEWDGKPRIDTALADYLGAEQSEYCASVMRLFMFGAIARVYTPGAKFDYCMILAGPQGVGKSTFFARLAMKPEWFNDSMKTLNADNAKIAEQLSGRWILELGELAAIKRADDVESVKQFISAQSDVYRTPYDKYPQQRPRCCVFGGTTNSLSFLVDKSGGRRFPVITVGTTKPKKSLFAKGWEDDFRQMWAEALHYYRAGEGYLTLPEKMELAAEEHRMIYTESDVRDGIIQEWLDNTNEDIVCVPMIYKEALEEYGKPTRKISNEIHEIMRRSITGWKLHPSANGRARCGKYGYQICYVRDGTDKFAPPGDGPVELL